MVPQKPLALEFAALKKLRNLANGISGMDKYSVRQHRLEIYTPLENSDTSLDFMVNENKSAFVASTLLNENDVFVATRIGLFLHKVLISNDREVPSNSHKLAYPDKDVWQGAAVAPSVIDEVGMLEMLYNGKMQIETNQKIRLKDFATSFFRTVPETQSSAVSHFQQGGNAIKPLVSTISFAGGDSNIVRIKMSNGEISNIAGDGTTYKNYAVLVFDGLVWVEGAIRATKAQLSGLLNEF